MRRFLVLLSVVCTLPAVACAAQDDSALTVHVDTVADAGSALPDRTGTSCAPAPPSVPCGETVCAAETPVCCKKPGSDGNAAIATCVKGACPSFAAEPSPSRVDEIACDEASDCPANQLCCMTYDRGLSRTVQFCGDCDPGKFSLVACRQDCDCAGGHCVEHVCK